MFDYIIRRLLLMIPTFFGTTLLVFVILQSVPSGPFEQAVMQIKLAKMQSSDEGGTASETNDKGGIELSEKVLEKFKNALKKENLKLTKQRLVILDNIVNELDIALRTLSD